MAKIQEEIVIVKLSKLVKETEESTSAINEDLLSAMEQVAQELSGAGVVVEVEIAK